MSYYEDFDEEQRLNFESDPMITGSGGDSPGCLFVMPLIVLALALIVLSIFN
jgi:hypothetical protein